MSKESNPTRQVTFCYRKIIDARSVRDWEKLVFEDSFTELKMQAQYFDPQKQYATYAEMIHHISEAKRLSFLVSASVTGYIRQLNGMVPDITNNLGKSFLEFKHFTFEIINSRFDDSSQHQVAINFVSTTMIWRDTLGSYLLISDISEFGKDEIHLVQIQPFLSINSIKDECD